MMIQVQSGRSGHDPMTLDIEDKPHAFDPSARPEYFETVLRRRIFAFLVDVTIILAMSMALYVVVLFLGVVTFGLAWLLFGLVFPVVALGYNAVTLSQPASATIGMRLMELEMRTWYGAPCYALLGVAHALVFYFTATLFTPFILLLALFNGRKRTLHDFIVGTVIVNTERKAEILRG